MRRRLFALVCAVLALLLAACSGQFPSTRGEAMTETTLNRADLASFARLRAFFGHQSVGNNVISGIPGLYASAEEPAPKIVETRQPPAGEGFLAHTLVGVNGDPQGKIEDFSSVLDGGMGAAVDVAALKFCYLDVTSTTDVAALFTAYAAAMDRLSAAHPKLRVMYTTVPLTTAPTLKSRVKNLLLRQTPPDIADNLARERYNALVRERYGATGRLFDIARVESTTAAAGRTGGEHEGQAYFVLSPELAADPGHLNQTGAERAAEEFVRAATG